MDMKLIYYFFLMICIKGVTSDTCETHKSCDECIQDPSVCVWCGALNFEFARCMPYTADVTVCPDNLENPQSSSTPSANLDFNSTSGSLVQIKPQSFNLNLRPGQVQDFRFSFKGVQDYPVDLYFLFDASRTMKNLRKHTALQAENIYNTMLKMTSDVYMGLGTFVDKNTLPYTVNVVANKSYSFRHHLSLGSSYTEFQKAVNDAPQGVNRDAPEGALDALAQAITCKEQIGWRNESRKILVLLTDGFYHAAGDGKAGGIFTPYDGKCYTENGVYTKELEMDYPSVSMINKLVRDNKVIVIFVVPDEKSFAYYSLSEVVTGSKVLTLRTDGDYSNMVPKLKEIYEDITRKIKLNMNVKPPGRPKHFEIRFNPDCTKESESCDVTGKENNFKEFHAIIKLIKYDDFDKTEIGVTIDGIDEKLTLNVNVIKNCDCKPEPESKHCNEETLQCGTCVCKEPRYGHRCQCVRNTFTTAINDGAACVYNATGQVCNDHGTCLCGICSCNEGFVGQYCQCLQEGCPLHDGKPCGGHGTCQCDRTCVCDKEYSGKACECYKSDSYCIGPGQKQVCSGRGICDCGTCKCEIADWDKRTLISNDVYCNSELRADRLEQQCDALTPCAICLLKEQENCPCPKLHSFNITDKLLELNDSNWHVCSNIRVDVGCYTNYTYMYDDEVYGVLFRLQKDKDCAMSYYLYGGILLVSLLLIGILTLVGWKLCTDYRDKQEYEKFLTDHKSEISPCDNPLYVPAATCFRNPAFRKRSVN